MTKKRGVNSVRHQKKSIGDDSRRFIAGEGFNRRLQTSLQIETQKQPKRLTLG